jgi:hypothetical protein
MVLYSIDISQIDQLLGPDFFACKASAVNTLASMVPA